jgi:hypothetical protein
MPNDVAIGHLLSLAELAGIFVAFGVLIGAIQSKSEDGSAKTSHVASASAIGVVTLLACVLPLLLHAYAVKNLWLYSSIIFLVLIGLGFYAASLQKDFRNHSVIFFRNGPVIAAMFWIVLEIPIQISLVFNILGLFPEYAFSFYLTAVIFNFAESGLFLVLMVFDKE